MKYLLDTHAFIWLISYPEKLSPTVVDMLQSSSNEFHLSAVSGWEIAIKSQIGKFVLPERAKTFVPRQMELNGITEQPVTITHVLATSELPSIHRDPFDRLLIAQSIVEKMPIITCDKIIHRYHVKTIW